MFQQGAFLPKLPQCGNLFRDYILETLHSLQYFYRYDYLYMLTLLECYYMLLATYTFI